MIEDDADGAYQEEILLLNKLARFCAASVFEMVPLVSAAEVRFKLDERAKAGWNNRKKKCASADRRVYVACQQNGLEARGKSK